MKLLTFNQQLDLLKVQTDRTKRPVTWIFEGDEIIRPSVRDFWTTLNYQWALTQSDLVGWWLVHWEPFPVTTHNFTYWVNDPEITSIDFSQALKWNPKDVAVPGDLKRSGPVCYGRMDSDTICFFYLITFKNIS